MIGLPKNSFRHDTKSTVTFAPAARGRAMLLNRYEGWANKVINYRWSEKARGQ